MRKQNSGFTLVELLVVLVIVAITLSAAVPSFQGMVARNRIATQTNDMLLAINLARSEALRVGSVVSVQAVDSSDDTDEFGPGWCVVVGNPGDCTGTTVRTFDALSGGATMDAIEDVGSIQFNSLGGLTNTGNAARNLDLCYPGQEGRRIQISLIGRSSSYRPGDPVEPAC